MVKDPIIKEIDNIITVYIINAFSISILKHPIGEEAKRQIYPSNNTTVDFGKKTKNTFQTYQIEETLKKFNEKNINNQNYLIYSLMSATTLVHDLIKINGLNKKTPEFEFLRHLRNAFSHGNTFKLNKNEPVNPAIFKNFEITKSLNGTNNVLIEYIGLGDVLELLEYIKENI